MDWAGIIMAEVALPVVVFLLGFFVNRYVVGSKHGVVFAAVLRLIEAILESYEIDVPEFLRELLAQVHDISEETDEFEKVIQDEISRVNK